MIKNNRLAGLFPWRNGGSVPSIGGGTTSLASAMAAVDAAEQALSAARSAARAAAKREGRSVRNLFSEGAFVSRASAERWVDAARAEAEAVVDILSRTISADAADETSPFQHLAARLLRSGAGGMREQHEAMLTLLSTGTAPGSLADKILAAAARARSTGADERPAPTGKAAEILAAGEKARRPTGSDDE